MITLLICIGTFVYLMIGMGVLYFVIRSEDTFLLDSDSSFMKASWVLAWPAPMLCIGITETWCRLFN